MKSFLKCSLTNELDGTQDDVLWQTEEPPTFGDDDDPMDIYYNDKNNEFDAETFFMSDNEEDFLGFNLED